MFSVKTLTKICDIWEIFLKNIIIMNNNYKILILQTYIKVITNKVINDYYYCFEN